MGIEYGGENTRRLTAGNLTLVELLWHSMGVSQTILGTDRWNQTVARESHFRNLFPPDQSIFLFESVRPTDHSE